MLEERIEHFQKFVNTRMEDFYLTVISEKDPQVYMLTHIFSFFRELSREAVVILHEYKVELSSRKYAALADRLYRIQKSAFDTLNDRLGCPVMP